MSIICPTSNELEDSHREASSSRRKDQVPPEDAAPALTRNLCGIVEELAFLGLDYATGSRRTNLLPARTAFVQRLFVPDIFCMGCGSCSPSRNVDSARDKTPLTAKRCKQIGSQFACGIFLAPWGGTTNSKEDFMGPRKTVGCRMFSRSFIPSHSRLCGPA